MAAFDKVWEQARARWPEIGVNEAEFSTFLSDRVDPDVPLTPERIADLFVACGCALDLAEAKSTLATHYLAELGSWVGRIRATSDFVDEVRQTVYLKLFEADKRPARIADYSGRGPLAAWLRVTAVRIAIDLLRGDDGAQTDPLVLAERAMASDADPELRYLKSNYGEEFRAAFHDAVRALPSEQRALLRLHYVNEVSVARLATLYKWSRRTAFRRMNEARAALHAGVVELLKSRLAISTTSLDSIIAAVRSSFDLTLSQLLRTGDDDGDDKT